MNKNNLDNVKSNGFHKQTSATNQSEPSDYNNLTPVRVYSRTDSFELGMKYALDSFDTVSNPNVIEKLITHLKTMAKEMNQGIFDSEYNLHDKLYENEFNELKADQLECKKGLQIAEKDLRDKERSLALFVQPEEENNSVYWMIFVFSTLVFGLIISITLHDMFFFDLAQDNSELAWLISFTFASIIGAFFTLAITKSSFAKNQSFNWLGLVGGFLAAIGLLFIRNFDYLSIGLAILDISILISLEAYSHFSRKRQSEVLEVAGNYEKATKERDFEKQNAEKWKEQLTSISEKIKNHIQYVESRIVGTTGNQQIEEALISTGLAGYQKGLEINKGNIFK